MQGVAFTGERQISLITIPDPVPGPGEVVVEIKASGMCGSDLKFYRTPRDIMLKQLGFTGGDGLVIGGHEPCGTVAAIGSGVSERQARIGERVMVHHYHGCGVCTHCKTGWTQMCCDGAIVYGANGHGAHAPYMKVPASTLVPLPDELTFTTGAAIACGTGTAYGALVRINVSARDTIAIVGQGPVGLSATQLALAMGARVIAIDIDPARIARAAEFGATWTVNAGDADALEQIRDLSSGGVTCAMDTSGTAAGRSLAVRATRAWGSVCLVGEGGTVTLDVSSEILRKQLTIVGSWTFSTVGQAACAQFVVDHAVPVDELFTDRWALDQAVEAYQVFDAQNAGKAVFVW